MSKIVVTELDKTCNVCPAQWEGRTDEGRYIYVRFRWGFLSIGIGDTMQAAVRGEERVFEDQISDDLDGSLSYEKLRRLTGHVVEWP